LRWTTGLVGPIATAPMWRGRPVRASLPDESSRSGTRPSGRHDDGKSLPAGEVPEGCESPQAE
jgi:hypothetical protein